MENILEVKNIGKKYQNKEGEILALKNVNFRVKKGEFVSIIGPSGCGKSTLLSIIAGLEEKTTGEIYIEGEKVNGISSKIGYMLQRDCLLEWRNILSNTMFGLEVKGKKDNVDKEYVLELLKKYNLYEFKDKYPSELSGGMRKRISLARTIIVDPEIMLYDEPTTGLDPVTSHEISLLINEIQEKYKTSSIIITHDIECAKTVANRIIMLQEGEVYKEGMLADFENSDDELVKSYFKGQNIRNTKTI